ncbi:MAG: zinc ribbon domain-containing protein [Myxococcota bacterium]
MLGKGRFSSRRNRRKGKIVPLFEFGCASCGRRFEELVSHGEESSAVCPFCGSEDTSRLLSRFAMPRGQKDTSEREQHSATLPLHGPIDHCALSWRDPAPSEEF